MSVPHVVLIPGLLCDAAVWQHQIRSLRSLTTVDVVDHPASDSLPSMAQALLEQAPERFALAGHSMGGRIAFEVFRKAPERIQALALMDTAYQPRSRDETGQREHADRYALLEVARKSGMRAMGLQWIQQMVHPRRLSDDALIESIVTMIAGKTPEIFAAQIRALLDRPDATPLLSQIQCPTLILCGEQDAWSPLARHEEMAALIPNSSLSVIKDCGHMSTMEKPELVSSAMLNWVRKVE